MARLSKNIYEGKREWAANRMSKNAETDTLTPEQHEALSNLASVRHDFHISLDSITKNDEYDKKNKLIKSNIKLKESGLKPMSFIPTDLVDYIDIDDINILKEIESVSSDDDNYQDWYDTNYERIYGELSDLNNKIEKYLSNIDEKHDTNYAPTGQSRRFGEGGEIKFEYFHPMTRKSKGLYNGKIINTDTDDSGNMIYTIKFMDKGKEKHTTISENKIIKQYGGTINSDLWNMDILNFLEIQLF